MGLGVEDFEVKGVKEEVPQRSSIGHIQGFCRAIWYFPKNVRPQHKPPKYCNPHYRAPQSGTPKLTGGVALGPGLLNIEKIDIIL